ncbi:MAG: SpaA isopeptide-forming pilin-related protein, partial [Oscillospiraceae bacterium]|nr:SpaA isopeptide-forming pilin-related protein [Oscillospiraceae bacterium]
VFAKSDIRAVAGVTVIPAGALLEIFGVGADGKGIITADLPAGNAYFIREMSTAAGYELDDTVYELVFDYAPEKGAVVVITVNSGKPIENRLMRGSLRIAKDFEGRETPINGVPFVITGTTIVGTEVTIHTKTDINGEILLENLLVGSYIIRESESDLTAGYVLSPEQSIIIAADETGRLAVYNWLVRGDIAVFKIDKNTGEVLAGAVFGLFQDGILIVEQTTDTDGIAKFMDIIYGTYEIRELFAPAGYLPVDEAFKVEIREKGKTITLEIANEKIPEPPASPQTGDDNDTLWPLILMGISVAVMIGLGIIAAKCKNRREDK